MLQHLIEIKYLLILISILLLSILILTALPFVLDAIDVLNKQPEMLLAKEVITGWAM